MSNQESMRFDVLIVGAGPAGLSAACRVKQLKPELSVCVLEKGASVGAHLVSGAVFDPKALTELFPDWQAQGAPVKQAVSQDDYLYLRDAEQGYRLPAWLVPASLNNTGCYLVSLGQLCLWLAEQAQGLGVEIYPGFAAAKLLRDDSGQVCGVETGPFGLDKHGESKAEYQPGMQLLAGVTLLAEGARGHLAKPLMASAHADPPHYALGFREVWEVPAEQHYPGWVEHTLGWPLQKTLGGGFIYHLENNRVAVGLAVDLNYQNPWLDPFKEFQRFKQHPLIRVQLAQGQRLSYAARVISKGGLNSLARTSWPGLMLIGCDAGTLNPARLKGIHTAMKSGILAAESVVDDAVEQFEYRLRASWLGDELYRSRNFTPALHKFGVWWGGAFNWLDQTIFGGRIPLTLHDKTPDWQALKPVTRMDQIHYPKPDNQISFDRLTSVYLSNTHHEEDQPCHLQLADKQIPVRENLPRYAEPAQRYCPAGVYELVEREGEPVFQINAQNCIHCKCCDIKDPAQNITWTVPEGGGGPNYPDL